MSVQKCCDEIQHEVRSQLEAFKRRIEASTQDSEGTFQKVIEDQNVKLHSQIDTLINTSSLSSRMLGDSDRVIKILDASKAEQSTQFDRIQKRVEQLFDERRNNQSDIEKVMR